MALWALLAGFSAKPPPPPAITVQVSLLPQKPLPKWAPPLPHFPAEPQIVAIAPVISMARPPPANIIRALPPPRAPAPSLADSGPAGAPPPPGDYLRRLEAHLSAYRNYPAEARAHRRQGTVELRFSLDRSGHVLSYDVIGSSGSKVLDNEAREMMRRADPFPPLPAAYRGQTLDLTVPVVFALN